MANELKALGSADGYMGLGSGIGGMGGGAMPFDSIQGDYSAADKANWACGLVKQTAGVIGSGVNLAVPGAGTAASIGIGVITDAVSYGISAYDTQKSIAALKKLFDEYPELRVPKKGEEASLREIILYCVGKRTSKRDRQIAKTVPGSGLGVSLFQAGKAAYKLAKGTKGVNRQKYADMLYNYASRNDDIGRIAQKVVAIIAGANFEQLLKKSLMESMKSSA